MRILGNEPSSVILSQTLQLNKLINNAPKVPKEAKAKRDGVKPTTLQFLSFIKHTILMLPKRYKSIKVDRRTWLHVPLGTLWSTRSDTHQVVVI